MPIVNPCAFRNDLPSLSLVCNLLPNLLPQEKCLVLVGLSRDFSLILNSSSGRPLTFQVVPFDREIREETFAELSHS